MGKIKKSVCWVLVLMIMITSLGSKTASAAEVKMTDISVQNNDLPETKESLESEEESLESEAEPLESEEESLESEAEPLESEEESLESEAESLESEEESLESETESLESEEGSLESETESLESEEEQQILNSLKTEDKKAATVQNLRAKALCKATIEISWDALEDADGYVIYRQIGNTSFHYLSETMETVYVDQTASETEYSFYRVYPFFNTDDGKITGSSDKYVFAKADKLPAVENLKASTVGEAKIKITWDSVDGAEAYRVYRQIGNTVFQYVTEISQTSYVDEQASKEEYNFYRVYPVYRIGADVVEGESHAYVFAKGEFDQKLPAVSGLKATTVGNSCVKLSWNAVSGAEGYLIYRQIGNTKFEYRYLVNKTNYTDTTASQDDYNYYRVYPYYTRSDGSLIQGLSDKYVFAKGKLSKTLDPVNDLKAYGVGDGQVYLMWNPVDNAEGYLIYRQIGNTKFEYRYIVGKTNFTDTTASKTEYNYYRVYPYYMENGSRIVGNSDSYVFAKGVLPIKLTAVKNLKAEGIKRGQVDVSWDAVSGAEGYLIYRQVGPNGSFEYQYMVTDTDYSDVSADQNEYNFYRVYPFYKLGDRNIVGPSDTYVYAKGIFAYGWYWIDGYKRYIDQDGIIDDDVSRLVTGPYLIKVYKWSNYLIIYAKDENGNYTVPVKAMITSCGNDTPTGTYYSPMKFRWLTMVGGSKAQWCTQIIGDYLFHSVPYQIEDPTTLYTDLMYNYLGTTQSLGCIRLQAGDAKWIYDNCDLGTEIYITPWEDSGPIAKPSFTPLPSWHTWDPTDPTTHYLCEQRGCH